MIEIPVTIGFDSTKIIGTMSIDETQLPKDMDFVWSLGVKITYKNRDDTDGVRELVEVSLIDNPSYLQYLRNRLLKDG